MVVVPKMVEILVRWSFKVKKKILKYLIPKSPWLSRYISILFDAHPWLPMTLETNPTLSHRKVGHLDLSGRSHSYHPVPSNMARRNPPTNTESANDIVQHLHPPIPPKKIYKYLQVLGRWGSPQRNHNGTRWGLVTWNKSRTDSATMAENTGGLHSTRRGQRPQPAGEQGTLW